MKKRTSTVLTAKVNEIQNSSVFQIGDSFAYTPKSKGYAVAQLSHFFIDDRSFYNDPIFHTPIPKPPQVNFVKTDTFHDSPYIHVRNINIISLGNSSVFQIGSTNYINSETRIKHVRRIW